MHMCRTVLWEIFEISMSERLIFFLLLPAGTTTGPVLARYDHITAVNLNITAADTNKELEDDTWRCDLAKHFSRSNWAHKHNENIVSCKKSLGCWSRDLTLFVFLLLVITNSIRLVSDVIYCNISMVLSYCQAIPLILRQNVTWDLYINIGLCKKASCK